MKQLNLCTPPAPQATTGPKLLIVNYADNHLSNTAFSQALNQKARRRLSIRSESFFDLASSVTPASTSQIDAPPPASSSLMNNAGRDHLQSNVTSNLFRCGAGFCRRPDDSLFDRRQTITGKERGDFFRCKPSVSTGKRFRHNRHRFITSDVVKRRWQKTLAVHAIHDNARRAPERPPFQEMHRMECQLPPGDRNSWGAAFADKKHGQNWFVCGAAGKLPRQFRARRPPESPVAT